MRKPRNLSGQKFNRLTALNYEGAGNWLFECECGNRKICNSTTVLQGKTKSCGCFRREDTASRLGNDGRSRTRLYSIWTGMKDRCSREKHRYFHRYGGRGIYVCQEWMDFERFRDWAFGSGYSDELQIERTDNDGPYSPANCVWATRKEQARNRMSNIEVEINGELKVVADWATENGLSRESVYQRIRSGWRVQDAVSLPRYSRSA